MINFENFISPINSACYSGQFGIKSYVVSAMTLLQSKISMKKDTTLSLLYLSRFYYQNPNLLTQIHFRTNLIAFPGGTILPWTSHKFQTVEPIEVRGEFLHSHTFCHQFDFHCQKTLAPCNLCSLDISATPGKCSVCWLEPHLRPDTIFLLEQLLKPRNFRSQCTMIT